MELERALKSSFLTEIALKHHSQQANYEDFGYGNGGNGVCGDDFSVDDLLDLSNGDFDDGSFEDDDDEREEKDSFSVSSQHNFNFESFSGDNDSESLPLAVPVDDLESLEWLSQFVDDSVPEFSHLCPAGNYGKNSGDRKNPGLEPDLRKVLNFLTHVPAKARTKRSRNTGRVWSLNSPSLTESTQSLSSSGSSSSTSCLVFCYVRPPPVKKQKKQAAAAEVGGCQLQRRCSHCQVHKTPQWRAGPLGAKTLCNACGVRFKSGRLFPEYRPACSPTFSGEVHSNSHRKVLEMRRRKEARGPESGLAPVVSSY